jgi:hypothetical protein
VVLRPKQSPDLNLIDLDLWNSIKSADYESTADTGEQLWQSIQDAANEVCTTPGVSKCVQASF